MTKNQKTSVPVISTPVEENKQDNNMFSGLFKISERFAKLNRLITRDLNNSSLNPPRFSKYTKSNIISYLENPYKYQSQIRDAITYIYGASSHFARLIQYFTSLTNLSYVVSPYKINPFNYKEKILRNNYRKVVNLLDSMNIETQLPHIIQECFKFDVFYGYIWETSDSITIQQLPSNYCGISSIEGNVFNVSFDFSYFSLYPKLLDFYPDEMKEKYELYKSGKEQKWIELNSPNAFAVKFNKDLADYPLPPFAGLLREVYDLEDYKDLKLTKTELENYALLVMKLLTDDEGRWLIDESKAREFFSNLSSVLPEEVGAVLSPMEITKINFEKTSADDADTISEAEQNLFTAAGVSSLIFNNEKASANALLTSIKADQALTFSIVQSIEDVLNRFIRSRSYGKNFKITFLNTSMYNQKEMADEYLKGCQYGLPFISHYAASMGVPQSELEALNTLEVGILNLQSKFVPLQNSAQLSSATVEAQEEAGRPRLADDELTDSGEQSREDGVEDGDW